MAPPTIGKSFAATPKLMVEMSTQTDIATQTEDGNRNTKVAPKPKQQAPNKTTGTSPSQVALPKKKPQPQQQRQQEQPRQSGKQQQDQKRDTQVDNPGTTSSTKPRPARQGGRNSPPPNSKPDNDGEDCMEYEVGEEDLAHLVRHARKKVTVKKKLLLKRL